MDAASIESQGHAGGVSVHSVKKANDQAEAEGQAAVKLIRGANPNATAETPADPLTGQNVDVLA